MLEKPSLEAVFVHFFLSFTHFTELLLLEMGHRTVLVHQCHHVVLSLITDAPIIFP